jgi:O-antigen/teichoic acid export membrane protein
VISKNFIVLLLGNVVTRVLSVFYIAVLARYIGTQGIGQLGTATALISVLILLVNFGFDPLITREVAANEQAAPEYMTNLIFLRFVLTMIFSALLMLIVLVTPYSTDMRLIIVAYAFAYVFDNFSGLARAVFQAYQHMEYEVAVELIRTFANVGISLLGIRLGWSLVLIVAASAFASLLKLILSAILIRWHFVRPTLGLNLAFCWQILVVSIPFFLLMTANVVQSQINILLLSMLDTQNAVGLYSAAAYPITMLFIVPSLFMDAIYPAFSHDFQHAPKRLAQLYRSAYKFMTLIGFPLGVGLMIVSRPVIDLMYGAGFEAAAPVLVLLALQLVTAVGYVNGALLNAAGQQTLFMKLRMSTLVFNVFLCLVLIPSLSSIGAALACAIPALIDYVFYTVLCHRLIGITPDWVGSQLKIALATALMAAACIVALIMKVNVFVVTLIPGAALYIVLLFALNIIDASEWEFVRTLIPVKRLSHSVSGHKVGHK